MEDLLSKSLFEEKKIIIIKRVSEKILNIVNEIISKKIDDIILIINSKNLEKKSKLRSYFENEKNLGYDRNIIELLFKCKGKFVMFMGDDDYFNKGILEKYLHL